MEPEHQKGSLYDIGKYNERRRNMYETDLFQDTWSILLGGLVGGTIAYFIGELRVN